MRRERSAWSGHELVIQICAALVTVCAGEAAQAQNFDAYGFKLPIMFDKLAPGQTNKIQSITSGQEVKTVGRGLFQVQGAHIEYYAEDGKTNLVANAPEALLSQDQRTATSTNRLEVRTSNGLFIEGNGYFCQLTNFNLFISNRVRTVIDQSLAQGNRAPGGMSARAAPTLPSGLQNTNTEMTVHSEQFHLNNVSNLVTYTGNVRVDNGQFLLSCAKLTIQRTTNGAIQYILAQTNVVILNKGDGSRASGDKAYYTIRNGKETMDLTGHALWLEGERTFRAEKFTFDLQANKVHAQKKALLKLPRSMFGQGDLFMPQSLGRTNKMATGAFSNQFVEIHSELMDIQLPGTNQPVRSLLARTNVLILSQADKMRATADRAFLSEATGVLELSGHAQWETEQRLAKGDNLYFDRTNRTFRAKGNAYLKVPLSTFGKQKVLVAGAATGADGQMLEATADDYDYQGDLFTFHNHVHGLLLEKQTPRGQIRAGLVTVKFSNQVERITARQKVFLEEFPVLKSDGSKVRKTMRSEYALITLFTNGLIDQIVANEMVHTEEQMTKKGATNAVLSLLDAERVTTRFFSFTNQVKDLVAERNVSMVQGNRIAHSEMAVYTATNNMILLTGHPSVDAPEARIPEADYITYDRTRSQYHFYKARAEGTPAAFRTNQSGLPSANAAGQTTGRQ